MTVDCVIDEKLFRLMNPDPDVIEEVINRHSVGIPDTFVPSANRIALVGSKLVWLVTQPGLYPPVGDWVGGAREGLFRRFGFGGDYILSIRRYDKLWSIERQKLGATTSEVLAFAFGPTPILLRNHKVARMVARQCHPSLREEAQCLWIPVTA
jgi:hypothetical protein